MSDRRHTPRPSLPEGYQYGDAASRESFEIAWPASRPAIYPRMVWKLDARGRMVPARIDHGPRVPDIEGQRTGDEPL